LFEAYKRFEAVVNSINFNRYSTNEPGGEKHFVIKKVIALSHITGGRLSFSLNSENLTELFIPLRDFGALVLPKTITQPTSTPPAKGKLSLKQIALIYIYNGEQITDENKNSIAEKYQWKTGHGLMLRYAKYIKSVDRIAIDTPKTGKNKIELIESIIPLLKNDACKKQATKELNTLKTKLGIDFE
jgi:hypothetical protein